MRSRMRPDRLSHDEQRDIRQTNAGKRVGERSREGDGWIGERRGRREPVRRGDVGANREWHG